MSIHRYSRRPLPPYRFVAGETPHPERDPRGHMVGQAETESEPLRSDSWARNQDYLYAVDLFNHGFYWEAHVYWERLWKLAEPESAERALLQALVQLAAARVKKTTDGAGGGVKSLANASRNLERVRALAPQGRFMGLDLSRLLDEMEADEPLLDLGNAPSA